METIASGMEGGSTEGGSTEGGLDEGKDTASLELDGGGSTDAG